MSIKKNLLATVSAVALSTTFASFANAATVPTVDGHAGGYTFAADVTIGAGVTVDNTAGTTLDTILIQAGGAGDTLTVASTGKITADAASDAVITAAAAAGAEIIVQSGGTILGTTGTAITLSHNFGSINNTGTITATTGKAILVNAAVTVTDITNNFGGVISATGNAGDAINVTAALEGKIVNAGTISSTTGQGLDIDANVSGGFTNSSTGTVTATTGSAIDVATGVNLNLTNAGTITATSTGDTVVYAGTSTSNIVNSGTISNTSSKSALVLTGALEGSVTNTGTISSATDIAFEVGNDVTKGITNSGTIKVTTAATAVNAISLSDGADASLTNSGTISATGTAATVNYAGASTATVTNSGSITNASSGAALATVGVLTGNITNSGTLSNVSGATGVLDINAAMTGDISNTGTIASGTGTGVDIGAGVVTGAFTNSGTISTVGGTAVKLSNAASQVTKGITNTGTINAGTSGIAFDGSTSQVAQTFTNTKGTLVGDIKLGINGVTQTLVLTGGTLDGDIIGAAGVDVITISGGFVQSDSNDGATGGMIVTDGTVGDTINFGLVGTKATDTFTASGTISGAEVINVDYGTVNIGKTITNANTSKFIVDDGATVNVTDTISILSDTNTIDGTLSVEAGKTLTIGGDLGGTATTTFDDGSNLIIELGGTGTAVTYGKIVSTDGTGAITFDADNATITVDLSGISGALKTTTTLDKVIDVDTLTATLSAIDVDTGSVVVTGSLVADADDADDIDIKLTRAGYTVGTTANGDRVGTILEALIAAGEDDAGIVAVTNALDSSSSTTAELNNNLTQLTPEVNGQTQQMAFESANASADAIDTRLASLRDGSSGIAAGGVTTENGAWAKFIAETADQDDRDGIAGYDADAWGVQLGGDRQLNDNVTLGVGLSYVKAEADSARGDSEADTYGINLYADYTEANWYVSGTLGYGYSDYEITRTSVVGDVSQTLLSDTNGNNYTAGAEVGYTLDNTGGVKVTPNASLRYSLTQVDNYRETGGTLAENIDHEDYAKFESGLGVDVAYPINANGVTYTPELRAKWLYDFLGEEFETTSSFVAGGGSFVTEGADAAQSTFVVGLGLEVLTQDNLTVSFDYDLSAREDYDSHAGMVSARFGF